MNLGKEGGTGNAIAHRYVARLVHGGTAHPAPIRIRRVSALLEDTQIMTCIGAQLVPAHACVQDSSATHFYRVVHHQRFVVAQVAVGEPIHNPIGQGFKVCPPSSLGYAVPTCKSATRIGVPYYG